MEKNSVLSIWCARDVQYITQSLNKTKQKNKQTKLIETMQLITHRSLGGATVVVTTVVAAVVMVLMVALSTTQLLVG